MCVIVGVIISRWITVIEEVYDDPYCSSGVDSWVWSANVSTVGRNQHCHVSYSVIVVPPTYISPGLGLLTMNKKTQMYLHVNVCLVHL